jgi:hypothetical protein
MDEGVNKFSVLMYGKVEFGRKGAKGPKYHYLSAVLAQLKNYLSKLILQLSSKI